jgi:hypothetical protein
MPRRRQVPSQFLRSKYRLVRIAYHANLAVTKKLICCLYRRLLLPRNHEPTLEATVALSTPDKMPVYFTWQTYGYGPLYSASPNAACLLFLVGTLRL